MPLNSTEKCMLYLQHPFKTRWYLRQSGVSAIINYTFINNTLTNCDQNIVKRINIKQSSYTILHFLIKKKNCKFFYSPMLNFKVKYIDIKI